MATAPKRLDDGPQAQPQDFDLTNIDKMSGVSAPVTAMTRLPDGYKVSGGEIKPIYLSQPASTTSRGVSYDHEIQMSDYGKDGATGPVPAEGYAAFADRLVRQGFIRKVFSIVTIQIAFTFALTALFVLSKSVRHYVQANLWTFYIAWVLSFVCIIAFGCFPNTARKTPSNYYWLGAFTLCQGYLVAVVSSFYTADTVLLCVGMTLAITVGLTLFAMQTRLDFTMAGGFLMSCLFALIILGIVQLFWRGVFIQTVYAALGALLFSCFIVYDVQMVVGGRKIQLSPDEYVFAALNLYLDVINLFLFLLRLFGQSRSD